MADYKSTHTGEEIDAGIDKAVTAESNWSLLMANLGIGRWANQTLYIQYNWTTTIYDDLMPQYTSYARTFANSEFKSFEGGSGLTFTFSCQFKSPKDNKKSFMGTFYNTNFNGGSMVIDLKNEDVYAENCEYTFVGSDVKSITFKNGTFYMGTWYYTFRNNPNLESIDGIDMTYSNYTWYDFMFQNCPKLKHLGIKHWHQSFNINASTAFEEADLVEIISNLDTVTTAQTLTMGTTNLAKLTDDEKKVATDKGWVLA